MNLFVLGITLTFIWSCKPVREHSELEHLVKNSGGFNRVVVIGSPETKIAWAVERTMKVYPKVFQQFAKVSQFDLDIKVCPRVMSRAQFIKCTKDAFDGLNENSTLIWVYSGHGWRNATFRLGNNGEFVSAKDWWNLISSQKIGRFIGFVDSCYSQSVLEPIQAAKTEQERRLKIENAVTNTEKEYLVITASSAYQYAVTNLETGSALAQAVSGATDYVIKHKNRMSLTFSDWWQQILARVPIAYKSEKDGASYDADELQLPYYFANENNSVFRSFLFRQGYMKQSENVSRPILAFQVSAVSRGNYVPTYPGRGTIKIKVNLKDRALRVSSWKSGFVEYWGGKFKKSKKIHRFCAPSADKKTVVCKIEFSTPDTHSGGVKKLWTPQILEADFWVVDNNNRLANIVSKRFPIKADDFKEIPYK